MIQQHPEPELLQAFVQGLLQVEELTAIQSHLETCPDCCAALEKPSTEDRFLERLRAADQAQLSSESCLATALTPAPRLPKPMALPRSSLWPVIPGYEILGELGRGGMGVVYKARHLTLNRLTALKVLLAGGHASPEDLVRFRTEAEAAGRLQHPHIIQIYEINAHGGLPYLALEFADGGNLAQHIEGQPQPPQQAAALIEPLARTMHAAHQKGIIHRDLKPANILLVKGEDWRVESGGEEKGNRSPLPTPHSPLTPPLSAFFPKIGDFGLVKLLGTAQHLTETGQVVGTPCYMAPEQAHPQLGQEVNATTDVYALGTILYELLTGRPPFQGPTATDTMYLVLDAEPVSPRRLQPGVPRDLEAICLKCLEKPARWRYASALEMAEDLGRFLNQQPVRARHSRWWERAWKWAKRRPTVASLSAAILLVTLLGIGLATWQWQEAVASAKAEKVARQQAEQLATKEAAARREADQLAVAEKLARAKAEQSALMEADANKLAGASELRAMQSERVARKAAIDYFQTMANHPDLKAIGAEGLRTKLLLQGRQYFQEFLRQRHDNPTMQGLLVVAQFELSRILGELGSPLESLKELERVTPLAEKLVPDAQITPQTCRKLHADCLHNLAVLYNELGRSKEAEQALAKALGLRQQLVDTYPADQEFRQDLSRSLATLGVLYLNQKRTPQAEAPLKKALALRLKLAEEASPPERIERDLTDTYNSLGALYIALHRPQEAEAAYVETRTRMKRLVAAEPHTPQHRRELASAYLNLGILYQNGGRFAEAEPSLQQAHGLLDALVKEHPAQKPYQQARARCAYWQGRLEYVTKRYAAAAETLKQALSAQQELVKQFPTVPNYRREMAETAGMLGSVYITLGKGTEAETHLRQAADLWDKLAADTGTAHSAREQGGNLCNLGILLTPTRPGPALKYFGQAIQVLEAAWKQAPTDATTGQFLRNARWMRAQVLTALKRHAEAVSDWDRALEMEQGAARKAQFRLLRAMNLAYLGHRERATDDAEKVAKEQAHEPGLLYGCGCVYAVAAATKDPRLADSYSARAVALLRLGFVRGFQNPLNLAFNPDLAAIRHRTDYRQLLADMQARGLPRKQE